MFSTINKALINIIPYLPITFIKLFSNRYIAGTTIHNALKTVEKVNEINLSATIDIDSILSANTQSLSSTFGVRFGQEDNWAANSCHWHTIWSSVN